MKIYIFLLPILFENCFADTILNNKNILNNNILNLLITLIFIIAYALILLEEQIKIKKSTLSIFFASIIWIIISAIYIKHNTYVNEKLNTVLAKYCELFLFLFVTFTYINVIKSLGILKLIEKKLNLHKITYKKLYWISGFLAFVISPIADNLTTALLISSIIKLYSTNNKTFITLSTINIIIASNAGGVFSPFGDITTLMIWQNNLVEFSSFIKIFLPAFVSFIIPSVIMSLYIRNDNIEYVDNIIVVNLSYKKSLIITLFLFILTIMLTIVIQHFLKISSSIGMLLGFSLIALYEKITNETFFSISKEIKNIDWETIIFFIGIMLLIEALSTIGLLENFNKLIFNNNLIQTKNIESRYIIANSLIGLLSAIIDNIPITYALIEMKINMTENEWLLLTLTTGTGGSILPIGSSAGIALLSVMKKNYTFTSHLKWSLVITFGYIAGIFTHIIINTNLLI